ncbi:MAG: hypothetical protein M3015_17025, partial [Bacteroidota bacterium]|nr:hypothetical protein [Bacteroidota bacterium]
LDILKFLIALRPELIKHLNDKDSVRLSWWYLYNGYAYNPDTTIEKYLLKVDKNDMIFEDILNASSKSWFNPINHLNFNFIAPLLDKLDVWEYEREWTFYIYKEVDFFYEFVDDNIRRIKNTHDSDFDYFKIVAKFLTYVISTNIRELRDLTTIYLLEFGKKFPFSLLELTEHSATLKDIYIYERLASCCYGVALNLQNNHQYVTEHLPLIAERLYHLQFAENPKTPVYNYIVIDSIKHLLDLALFKKVSHFNENEIHRITCYEYSPPYDWIPPTEEQLQLINQSSEMDWPEPIGMDFGIYTIPRLMIEDNVNDREAISNVYKRIFEIGYRNLESPDFSDERFKDFYWGHKIRGLEGKVDRLGKKYSWKGFFDYAGFLLLHKQLNVFEKTNSGKEYYQRLGDVDIDISIPNPNYKEKVQLYTKDLLSQRDTDPEWYKETQIDTIVPFFEYQVSGDNYVMLYGRVDQRLDKEYKVRSFILAETLFIKKTDEINNLQINITNKIFDWNLDVHISADHLRNVYFGELYWADSMSENEELSKSLLPTGNIVTIKTKISIEDTLHITGYRREDIGKEIEKIYPEKLHFESEPTLAYYLWESNSKILAGHGEYYPSIKMGKYLGIKADPSEGKILDANLKECFICIDHGDKNQPSNTFNYMRSDLLRKYMHDNNLVLIYQVKQHSYDENLKHNRQMKFYILE